MTDPVTDPAHEHVEALLRDVGRRLDVPAAPDVTAAVLARLDEPAPSPVWRPVHRLAAAAAVLLVALAVAMTVSPTVRAAVRDLLRIGGVEIVDTAPPPRVPTSVPPGEPPGERRVTLDQARAAAAFPLRTPAALGDPDTVLLVDDTDSTPPRVVTMTYRTPAGTVRIDQFDGRLDPMFRKFSSAEDVVPVTVDGDHGFWVDRPHPVFYLDRDGVQREEAARLAVSTLIWERGGVTHRVEGASTRAEALAIAESLR